MRSITESLEKANSYKATILSIGTANPPNQMTQEEFVNFYFRVTNLGDHMTQFKDKFKLICEKTGIRKRYMHLTEDFLKENPNISDQNASSFNIRQDILIEEVPKLGHEASLKAIEEWGQPKSNITHIIFCTVSGIAMPGCDYELLKLLDLQPTVQRFMLYQQGCYGGGTVLRLAKYIVDSDPRARVLAVCSEFSTICFRQSNSTQMDSMVGQALFTDGAAAMIIGANADESIGERPIFEIVSAVQSLIPDTKWGVGGQLRETGGPTILNKMEDKLSLHEQKLDTSRYVLSEFGNMWSATVIFVLDEMRKKSLKEGKSTTGEGLEYGVLLGVGPGVTIETVVLRSFAINAAA